MVLTNHPLKQIMSKPDVSGRMVKWAIETREWSMTQYLAKFKEMVDRFDRCTIHQIPRDENAKADALSKFGAMVEGVKERKIAIIIREAPVIYEKVIHVINEMSSWRIPFIQYLKEGKLLDDPIAARRLQFKVNQFTMLGEELYKRTTEGILLKCLDGERVQYVMTEVHERSYWNHLGGSCQKFAGLLHSPATPLEALKVWDPKGAGIAQWNSASREEDHGMVQRAQDQQSFTALGNPQVNGQVEVTNRILLQHLKTRFEGAKRWWVEEIPGVLWAYRTTPRTSTGEIPFCLVYGSKAIIPAEIGEETARVSQYNPQDNA
ncbi:UNVERIFIED_CONTAM: hypothetical protein Sindi_2581500 [Sesamum indicum]